MPDLRHLIVTMITAVVVSGPAWAGAYEDIIVAANQNNTEAVVGLLNRGMDVNTADATGTTLLMIAVRTSNEELLDFLLRNKANVLKKNRFGDSALALAALAGHQGIVQRLLSIGAEIDSSNSWSALQYAAFGGHAGVIRYLAGHGADVNRKAPNGYTPLMLAAKQGHEEAVRALIDLRAQIDVKDQEGNTARKLALESGHSGIADLLKLAGATD